MIRVLHVIDKLSVEGSGIHGITRALGWWAERLEPARVRFRVLSLRGDEPEAEAFLAGKGMEVRFVDYAKFDPRVFFAIAREARRWNATVLHLHGYAAADFGRLVARMLGLPNVVHEHVVFPSQPTYQVWADRLLAGITDASLAISPAVAEFMVRGRAVPARTLETFFYGIPFEEFTEPAPAAIAAARESVGIPPGVPVIATAGRLAAQKGLDGLVRAFAAVAGKHGDARLLLVGEGPERERVQSLARALGLGERVCLAGYREDVRPWIAMAEVFVIPSHYEGGPLTLFEAMRLGRPILSTPVGLVPQALEEGRNGRVVPVGNEDALASALDELLSDPARAASFGAAARADSEAWDVRRAVERLMGFYGRLVGAW